MTKPVSLQTQKALEKFNSFTGIEGQPEKVSQEAAKFDLWKFLKQLFGFEEKDQKKDGEAFLVLNEAQGGEGFSEENKFEKTAPSLEENKGQEEEKIQTQELSDADREAITDAVRKAFEQGKSGEDVHKFLKENEIKGDIGAAFKQAIETVQMEMNKAAKEAQVAAKLEAEKESEEEKEGHTKEISAQENEKSQNAEKPTASLDAVIPGKESSGFNLSPEEEENLAAVAKLFGEEEVEFQETTKNVGENFKSDASKEVVNDEQQQKGNEGR